MGFFSPEPAQSLPRWRGFISGPQLHGPSGLALPHTSGAPLHSRGCSARTPHHIGDRRHVAGRPGSSVASCRRPSSSVEATYPSPIGRRRATAVDARRTSLPFLDGAGDESRRPDRRRRGREARDLGTAVFGITEPKRGSGGRRRPVATPLSACAAVLGTTATQFFSP